MRITGGKLKNHKLISPKGTLTRPTSEKLRQIVFNICQHQIEGAHFLDLFAGSGAMGIEALSRGALHATFIEKNRRALAVIRENLSRLNLSHQATLISGDALFHLKRLAKKGLSFDLIYADPPYGEKRDDSSQTHLDAILLLIDQVDLLAPTGKLFFEESTLPTAKLTHLILKKKRKIGRTYLFQYETKSRLYPKDKDGL